MFLANMFNHHYFVLVLMFVGITLAVFKPFGKKKPGMRSAWEDWKDATRPSRDQEAKAVRRQRIAEVRELHPSLSRKQAIAQVVANESALEAELNSRRAREEAAAWEKAADEEVAAAPPTDKEIWGR